MKKKILVLGASGMAGHMIYSYLDEIGSYEMFNVVFRNRITDESIFCDVHDEQNLKNIIQYVKPDIVVNCIGALILESNSVPANAIFLNGYFPHLLVKLIDEIDGKLIHISTDCVFSGKKGDYNETDFRDADDVYGRSKALGEINSVKHVTLRTSIIGPELKINGEGLFHWFMRQQGVVKGYSNVNWSGITTLELARQIVIVIEKNLDGLFHLTNGKVISKFDLLKLMQKQFNKDESVTIVQDSLKVSRKNLCKSELFSFNIPSYNKMMEELKQWILNNSSLYSPFYIELYENLNHK